MNFIERPDRSRNLDNDEFVAKKSYNSKDTSAKQKLMKTLLKFKKNKRPPANKGGMQTVKLDF